tara:strand:+ start:4786 stop:5832 length:1047 start_codon:yes stop_codon:yes gene_type:complete
VDKSINKASRPSKQILYTCAAFIIVIAGMRAADEILIPFLLAIFIAVISNPLVATLRSRGVPIGVAILFVIFIMVALGFGITSLLGNSLNEFSSNLPLYQDRLKENAVTFFSFLEKNGIAISGKAILERFDPGSAMSITSSILTGLGAALSNTVLILVMVVFMLLEATQFNQKISQIFSEEKKRIEQIASFSQTVNRYMVIKTGTSLATGIIATTLLMLIGVDYAILWGFLTFLFNYVPTIGSFIAAVPPALIALIQLGLLPSIITIIGYITINLTIGSFLEPRFLGRGLGLSTLIVFLSLIFWGWVFGPIGMVLSVPLTTTIKVALSNSEATQWFSILLDAPKKEGF